MGKSGRSVNLNVLASVKPQSWQLVCMWKRSTTRPKHTMMLSLWFQTLRGPSRRESRGGRGHMEDSRRQWGREETEGCEEAWKQSGGSRGGGGQGVWDGLINRLSDSTLSASGEKLLGPVEHRGIAGNERLFSPVVFAHHHTPQAPPKQTVDTHAHTHTFSVCTVQTGVESCIIYIIHCSNRLMHMNTHTQIYNPPPTYKVYNHVGTGAQSRMHAIGCANTVKLRCVIV